LKIEKEKAFVHKN